MNFSGLAQASPLYEYWRSAQDDDDDQKRLSKANLASNAVDLFIKEPYKWENLYQSIGREIIKGDMDSIRSLKILIDTLNVRERDRIIKVFREDQIFREDVICRLAQLCLEDSSGKNNLLRFLRILLSIFLNPYGLEIKRDRRYIYEHTGAIAITLRKSFSHMKATMNL